MANLVLTVLSLTIGFFFILMGTLKLSPLLSDEVYRELRKVFIRSAKVFPFVSITGWAPNPHMYRKVIGTVEVVSGCVLAFIPGRLKQVANMILFVVMCGAVYTHWAMKEGMEKMTPALVFGLLLGCRFIVYLQVKTREARASKGNSPEPEKESTLYEKPPQEKKAD